MAPSRLTEPQKEELVARYSQGESSLALAQAYGVSANTVSRVVRAALPAELYESLKQQRLRPSADPGRAAPDPVEATPPPSLGPRRRRSAGSVAVVAPSAGSERVAEPDQGDGVDRSATIVGSVSTNGSGSADEPDSDHGVLAIDDADDFADDQGEEAFDDDDGSTDNDDLQSFVPIAVSLTPVDETSPVTCRPLDAASFNGGVYLLVDKTVELQPRPLRDFSELGALPADEAERQAISVFINPREAKRQCGRSQRVIKMPDPRLLERTAPYLLAQGISRVVVEGSLYALPGS